MTFSVPNIARYICRLLGSLVFLPAVLLAGCGGEEVVKLADYIEELEFDRPLEEISEVKVNSYRFPCAARHRDASGADLPPLWVQMSFDLYVQTTTDDKEAVEASIERHRGFLDDLVMTVCRGSSIDQLQDNGWNAIRTRLLDEIRPLLGTERVRKVIFSYSAPWEPI